MGAKLGRRRSCAELDNIRHIASIDASLHPLDKGSSTTPASCLKTAALKFRLLWELKLIPAEAVTTTS